jgi:N-acetylneuraminic acid mutarotase
MKKPFENIAVASAVLFCIASMTLATIMLGCGGKGNPQTATQSTSSTPTRNAQAQVTITWPDRTNTTRLIPVAANSLKITLQNAAVNFTTTQVVARPVTGSSSTVTFSNLPPGDFVATATAHSDNAGAAVPVLASGTQSFTGQPNQTFAIALTMNSTIDHLALFPSPLTVTQGSALPVTVSARNTSDQVVLTSSSAYTWSIADTTVATVAGTTPIVSVNGLKIGSTTLSVTENESGKSLSAPFSVTATPTPTPTPWNTEAPLPIAVMRPAALVTVNDKIYYIGGAIQSNTEISKNTTYIYDPLTKTWSTGAPMPLASQATMGVVVNGKIHVMGGGYQPDNIPRAAHQVYDLATNTWSLKAPLPVALRQGRAVASGNFIYFIGGSTSAHDVDPPSAAVATNYRYDDTNDTWTTMAPMPSRRHGGAVALVGQRIFVIGGVSNAHSTIHSTNEVYDIPSNTWSTKASLPFARTLMACSVFNGQIYIIGGATSPNDPTQSAISTCQMYDPATDIWTTRTPMLTSRYGVMSTVYNNRIYVLGGGIGNSNGTSSIHFAVNEVYTPAFE